MPRAIPDSFVTGNSYRNSFRSVKSQPFHLSEFAIWTLCLDKRSFFPLTQTGKQATNEVL
jgi:hypothetical protein